MRPKRRIGIWNLCWRVGRINYRMHHLSKNCNQYKPTIKKKYIILIALVYAVSLWSLPVAARYLKIVLISKILVFPRLLETFLSANTPSQNVTLVSKLFLDQSINTRFLHSIYLVNLLSEFQS